MSKTRGQGLVEYSLTAGALVLLTIGGLSLVATNFTDLFENVGNRLVAQGPATGPMTWAGGGTGGTATATEGGGEELATEETAITPVVSGAYETNIAGFKKMVNDLPNLIETSGASGTTKIMVAYMQSLADEMLNEGEIKPQEHANLVNLANKGHKMASITESIETFLAAQPAGTMQSTLHHQQVQHQGITLTYGQLIHELGLGNGASYTASVIQKDGLYAVTQNQSPHTGASMTEFLEEYARVADNDLANTPELKSVVETLSSNIVTISGYFSSDLTVAPHKTDVSIDQGKVDFVNKATSSLTHTNSAGICTAGNGEDSGKFCQG